MHDNGFVGESYVNAADVNGDMSADCWTNSQEPAREK